MNYSHVGFVVGFDAKNIWLMGGNQPQNGAAIRDGVEVNITKYSRTLVKNYVLPLNYNPPPLGKFE